ncbi:MAG: hypothetical protein AAFR38_01495 [Planctomycetota bacterium]
MTTRSLIPLGALTAVLLVLAVMFGGSGVASTERQTVQLLPELADRDQPITSVRVVTARHDLRLSKQGELWRVDEPFDGFEARIDFIDTLIDGLAELNEGEPKASDPRWHERLGLREPEPDPDNPPEASDPASVATRVVLRDASDRVLADVIVGVPTIGGRFGRFARRAGEDQTYLIPSPPRIAGDPQLYLPRPLFRIFPGRMRELEISHPDGDTLNIINTEQGTTAFRIRNVAAGTPIRATPTELGQLFTVLNNFNAFDIRAASERPIDPGEAIYSTYRTWDGLTVTATSSPKTENGSGWVGLAFEASDDASDEVVAEAADLNERLGAWRYRVRATEFGRIVRRFDEISGERPTPSLGPTTGPVPGP